MDKFVLDACALLSFIYNEPGCDVVQKALGQTSVLGAAIFTSDHHEFDAVEQKENIGFCWIR